MLQQPLSFCIFNLFVKGVRSPVRSLFVGHLAECKLTVSAEAFGVLRDNLRSNIFLLFFPQREFEFPYHFPLLTDINPAELPGYYLIMSLQYSSGIPPYS